MSTQARCATLRAFTLVELVVAITLGALLVVGMALTLQVFAGEVEELRDEANNDLEECISLISQDVRTAWWVDIPSSTQLDVYDPYGNLTSYALNGTQFKVTRPDGSTGRLLNGVASISFSGRTTRRLREAEPMDVSGVWVQAPAGEVTEVLRIDPDEALAIGFTVPLDAPDYVNTLDDVTEQLIEGLVTRVDVPMNFLNVARMEFCHLWHGPPPHNPSHPLGPNPLAIDLYRARAPGDPRPLGAPLATVLVTGNKLPTSSHIWWDPHLDSPITPPEVIDPPDGVAWGYWEENPQIVLVLPDPVVDAPIELPAPLPVKPGEAYSLVFRPSGLAVFSFEVTPGVTTPNAPVAIKSSGGEFVKQNMTLTFRLQGDRTFTQTEEHEVVDQVTMVMTRHNGETVEGSVLVAGQKAAEHPWLGVVPNEVKALEKSGQ